MMSNTRQRKNIPEYVGDGFVKDEVVLKNKLDFQKPPAAIKYSIVGFLVVLVLAMVLFINAPSENYPVPFELPSPPKLEGVLAPNNLLANSIRILEGNISGPEFLLFNKGFLYTGTADGKILEISKDKEIRVVARLGKEPCGRVEDLPNCGRPLGMEFDSDGYLVVCDAYLGIFRVDVDSGEVQELLPASAFSEGRAVTFLNDLEITKDGVIYFTLSSTDYQLKDFMFEVIRGSPSGRLMRFDPMSGEVKVLLTHLNFANGLLLSEFDDFILISEVTRARILKHHIRGINAGQTEVFADNMPCLPDNLHGDRRTGTVWVGCSHLRHSDRFSLLDFIQGRTWLRRLLMELPMSKLMRYLDSGAMLVEISGDGKILRTLADERNAVAGSLSHVVRDEEGRFYAGSYVDDFIVVLDPREAPEK